MQITTETITPAKAKEYLAHNQDNRNLRKKRILSYATQMKRGQWKATGDPIRFASSGRLLDGQHRLQAIVESGVTIPMVVIRGLEEETFKVLDSGLGRSPADALGISVTNANNKAAACRLLFVVDVGGDPRKTEDMQIVTRIDVADYYATHQEDIDAANLIGSRMYTQFHGGNRTAWIAMACLVQRANATHADEFLEGIYTGANLAPGDPRLALRNYLANNRRLPTAGHHLGMLIKAWNAWMKGESRVVMVLRDDETFPEVATRRNLKATRR
jgi:hypothetical protein